MIKGHFGFAPTCPKCSKPLVAGSTIYDPKTVCQCPVDWEKLAKAQEKRADKFCAEVEKAHRKAAKSKLHFD